MLDLDIFFSCWMYLTHYHKNDLWSEALGSIQHNLPD